MTAALECLRCHAVYDDQRLFTGCPRCARESVNVNLTVKPAPDAGGPVTPASFPAAPRSLWRFRRLAETLAVLEESYGLGLRP